MVELKVRDSITLCASIKDGFCQTIPSYSIGDINISSISGGECGINYFNPTPGCNLPFSGIQLEFQWVSSTPSTQTGNCDSSLLLKSLGTANTDSNGIAAITHIIDELDASYYNQNNSFDLRVCIRGSVPVIKSGYARRYFHTDPIIFRGSYVGNACIPRDANLCSINDQTIMVYENPVYSDGTLTSVCIQRSGTSLDLPNVKAKIFRLIGDIWSLVGETSFQPLQNDVPTIFNNLNIIVKQGDYIGLYTQPGPSACIFANSGPGQYYYVKMHPGDVGTNTNNNEWSNLNYYRVSISATIVPCLNISCPDKCFGTDLYHQICDPDAGGCIKGSLANPDDPSCGAAIPTHSIDLIVTPWSWYTPGSAAEAIIEKIADIDGALVNFFSNIIDFQYINTEIFPSGNKVIIRINLRQLSSLSSLSVGNINCLALPLLAKVVIMLVLVALIVILIGMIVEFIFYKIQDLTNLAPPLTNAQLTDAGDELITSMMDDCEKVTCVDVTNQDERALCIKNCHDSIFARWKEYQEKVYPDADHTPLDTGKNEVDSCYDVYMASGKTEQDYTIYLDCIKIKRDAATNDDKNNTLNVYDPNAPAGAKSKGGFGSLLMLAGLGLVGMMMLSRSPSPTVTIKEEKR